MTGRTLVPGADDRADGPALPGMLTVHGVTRPMRVSPAWRAAKWSRTLCRLPVLEIHVGKMLTLSVNCSTALLTAADRMDSNMSKSWCAPGSSA